MEKGVKAKKIEAIEKELLDHIEGALDCCYRLNMEGEPLLYSGDFEWLNRILAGYRPESKLVYPQFRKPERQD